MLDMTNLRPLVSVIIPNYNHAEYLKPRIDSVLNQTYENIEVIILDDCSTDNSANVIMHYANHPRVKKIIFNDVNSGSTFKQWEKGISLASGKYVWIAESDDIAEPNFVESLIDILSNDYGTDIAYCGSELIDQNSNPLELDLDVSLRKPMKPQMQYIKWASEEFIKRFMSLENSMYNASAIIFKKELWAKIDKSFTELRSCGDWLCWLRMLQLSKSIIWYKDNLNKFRQHTNKVTSRAKKNGLELIERKTVVDYLLSTEKFGFWYKNIVIGRSFYLISKVSVSKSIKNEIWKVWNRDYGFIRLRILCDYGYRVGTKLLNL